MVKQSLLNLNHIEPKNKYNFKQDFSKVRDRLNRDTTKAIPVSQFKRGIS
jgi:hypothetical protein